MRVLLLFLLPIMMFAHSLSVTSSYDNAELFVESFFGDGTACKGCKFTVTKGEKEVFSNKLDSEGVFENKVELKPPFAVHIDGGMGHWADVTVEGNEFEDDPTTTTDDSVTTMNGIDEKKLRKIIRSELNKQNSKIEVMIEKHKSKLEQMLIGLGYILGIFGLWQLFMRRQKK